MHDSEKRSRRSWRRRQPTRTTLRGKNLWPVSVENHHKTNLYNTSYKLIYYREGEVRGRENKSNVINKLYTIITDGFLDFQSVQDSSFVGLVSLIYVISPLHPTSPPYFVPCLVEVTLIFFAYTYRLFEKWNCVHLLLLFGAALSGHIGWYSTVVLPNAGPYFLPLNVFLKLRVLSAGTRGSSLLYYLLQLSFNEWFYELLFIICSSPFIVTNLKK